MPRKLKYKLKPLNTIKENIGQRITRIRKENGITQKELADLIGITQTLMSDYETGRVRIFADIVTRIAIALEVSTDLIHGIENFKVKNSNPNLRFFKRIKEIEKLPEARKKEILRTLDDLILASTKKTKEQSA